jgi:peptidoglycan/LPS O-acetylase OafA/YrhL
MQYIKSLDGLRALAVSIVVFSHSDINFPRSGGVGVSIFFVLSGFLITSIIVNDLRQQRFRLKNFYSRRFLRLLPCLVVTCLFLLLIRLLMGTSVEWKGIAAALTYTTNWVRAYNLFDTGSLAHCWSLAIEEQYYLLWPFTIIVLEKYSKQDKVNFFLLLGFVLIIAIYRATMSGTMNSIRINFGTDTRMDGLILGSALAYLIRSLGPTPQLPKYISIATAYIATPVAIFILWQIMTGWSWADPRMAKYGYLLVALAAAIIILDISANGRSKLRLILEIPPLMYIGKISYGIYLLHYPLNSYLDWFFADAWLPSKYLSKIIGSVIIAAISFHLVESQFLRLKQYFK